MKKQQLNAKGLACPLPVIQTKKLLVENDVVETTVDNFVATQNLEKLATQLGYNYSMKEISNTEYIVTIKKDKDLEDGVVIDTLLDKCVVPVTQAKRTLEEETKVILLVKAQESVDSLEKFAAKNNYSFIVKEVENGYKVIIEREEKEKQPEIPAFKDDSYIVVINKSIMGHGSEELGKRLIKAYLYGLTEQEVLPQKIIFYNGGALLVDKERSHVLNELRELDNRGVEIVCCGACIDYNKIDLAVGNPTNMYFIVEDMRKANKIIHP
ncbi:MULTISPECIES: sulfurtransferase-like selenium metabolism protein YedF [Gemella]|uniref:sulfurtransferase-like selenium metabolism protein YedF n=1 Tax=Gemella TaxID=1378 RepID=UPI000767F2CA|nr:MULTISPECIES: sulfurtransferase-like selenium metabolism protein YedF [Gemella]AME10034.1 selenium metabolism protein [Gemella sp. oral taxon 928]AXI26170.1 sulfurtransferase-like selenium metabolism protein YedF [Gemella sp. ND 6198]